MSYTKTSKSMCWRFLIFLEKILKICKNVKTVIKPMDFQRFWSAMLTLGPPKNIENHQNTIGFAMVSVFSQFLTEAQKKLKNTENEVMSGHENHYNPAAKLCFVKKCRFCTSTGDLLKMSAVELRNMYFRLGGKPYFACSEIDEKTIDFIIVSSSHVRSKTKICIIQGNNNILSKTERCRILLR